MFCSGQYYSPCGKAKALRCRFGLRGLVRVHSENGGAAVLTAHIDIQVEVGRYFLVHLRHGVGLGSPGPLGVPPHGALVTYACAFF